MKSDLQSLCDAKGVQINSTLDGVRVDEPTERGGKGWEHRAWTVTITYQGRKLMAPFKAGMAIKRRPTAADVLSSLCLDARAGDMTFEEWCGDFGYDTDSRRALDAYLSCQAMSTKTRKLLGVDFLDFANAEH